MVQYQFTLFCADKKYKPISTLIDVPSDGAYLADPKTYQRKALSKICAQRNIDLKWLRRYNYTEISVRAYDPIAIKRQNEERYERIKKERGWA